MHRIQGWAIVAIALGSQVQCAPFPKPQTGNDTIDANLNSTTVSSTNTQITAFEASGDGLDLPLTGQLTTTSTSSNSSSNEPVVLTNTSPVSGVDTNVDSLITTLEASVDNLDNAVDATGDAVGTAVTTLGNTPGTTSVVFDNDTIPILLASSNSTTLPLLDGIAAVTGGSGGSASGGPISVLEALGNDIGPILLGSNGNATTGSPVGTVSSGTSQPLGTANQTLGGTSQPLGSTAGNILGAITNGTLPSLIAALGSGTPLGSLTGSGVSTAGASSGDITVDDTSGSGVNTTTELEGSGAGAGTTTNLGGSGATTTDAEEFDPFEALFEGLFNRLPDFSRLFEGLENLLPGVLSIISQRIGGGAGAFNPM